MTPITYLIGDATQPIGSGRRFIVHCCNDAGVWGKGFVKAISARWPQPEADYRAMLQRELGSVSCVGVTEDIAVVNLIGQHGIGPSDPPPIRYDAIRAGLESVRRQALMYGVTVHMPRMGAGLAGGDWSIIEQIIREELCAHDVHVFVYDLQPQPVKNDPGVLAPVASPARRARCYLVGHLDTNVDPPVLTAMEIYSSPAGYVTHDLRNTLLVDMLKLEGEDYGSARDAMLGWLHDALHGPFAYYRHRPGIARLVSELLKRERR